MVCDVIAEITQSVLAILLVVGGGVAILNGNGHVPEITSLMGAVVGFYFTRQAYRGSSTKSNGGSAENK